MLGKAVFHGLTFEVSSDTLIPRSPIGELITEELQPWMTREPASDFGPMHAASGCLGILASEVWPEPDVVLADISEPALAVAERNIDRFEARPYPAVQSTF